MIQERTLSIIKPDAVRKNCIGQMLSRFETAGLKIIALQMRTLTQKEAEGFYAVHQSAPFFNALVSFMISGPIVALLLEGEGAIRKTRNLMGATDPKQANPGTLRADFGEDIENNAVHGSDSPEAAAFEIPFFFQHDASP